MDALAPRPAPWEFERHRRGSIRWYPFDALLFNGLGSAGSVRALASPIASLFTGASTATPQNRGIEQIERKQATNFSDIWTGIDGLNYWSRPHRMTCFMGFGISIITPIGGRLYGGIFLGGWNQQNSLPPVPTGPGPARPVVLLRYARNGLIEATPDERYELVTAKGDGSEAVITRLTGISGPISDLNANPRTQRLEIMYMPGEYVSAAIDGVVGATNTTGLPDTAIVPTVTQVLAGHGVWLEASNAGDAARMDFHSLMIETYRP